MGGGCGVDVFARSRAVAVMSEGVCSVLFELA